MGIYPPKECACETRVFKGALIAHVEKDSPAYDAGFEPGCFITHIDNHPVRDIIDWRWLSADDEMTVDYVDLDGEVGTVELFRDSEEGWGIQFEGVIFDSVKTCRNACTFCFMHQLPQGMRPSLSLRDDDFRLSFLSGTFVTLTNLSPEDEVRIIEQRISPLRVSLHAINQEVRYGLIGKHASHGLDALERLLDAGVQVDVQIVLVPEVNDGAVLDETIQWAYAHPGITNVGVVPLGFTRYQTRFQKSFDDKNDALRVLAQLSIYQKEALAERGEPWVYAADEFYRNAYRDTLLENLPEADFYCGYPLFEDGIGIVRSSVDEFFQAIVSGKAAAAADAFKEAGTNIRFICGESMQPYFDQLIDQSPLCDVMESLTVKNDYFGGNVNVTGLLCGCDIVSAVKRASINGKRCIFLIPDVVFNTDGFTLDGFTLGDIRRQTNQRVYAVASNPLDYIQQITEMIEDFQCSFL